jgi:hypothetical protein
MLLVFRNPWTRSGFRDFSRPGIRIPSEDLSESRKTGLNSTPELHGSQLEDISKVETDDQQIA